MLVHWYRWHQMESERGRFYIDVASIQIELWHSIASQPRHTLRPDAFINANRYKQSWHIADYI